MRNPWLMILWLVWAALLFGGFAFGELNTAETRRMPTWTRMGSSLALVATGWSWFALAARGPAWVYMLGVAVGMTLGCLGDFFNAHLLLADEQASLLGGMASFGLGHVAYIAGFLVFGNQRGLNAPAARWGSWLAWMPIGVVGWYLVVYQGASEPNHLHWAALPYALLLASTAGFATGLAVRAWAFLPLAVGAALFLVSDLILAGQLFSRLHFPLISDVVWLTYGPGQMLIVYSCGTALACAPLLPTEGPAYHGSTLPAPQP